MKKYSIISFFFLIFISSHAVYGQLQKVENSAQQEIGVSFSSFNSFSLVYKKELSENKFLRISGVTGGIGVSNAFESYRFRLGANIGIENRRKYSDRLTWFHGPQIGLSTNVNIVPNAESIALVPHFSYILGGFYELSDRFYFSAEIKPRLAFRFTHSENSTLNDNYDVDLNFGSGATFSIMHRL